METTKFVYWQDGDMWLGYLEGPSCGVRLSVMHLSSIRHKPSISFSPHGKPLDSASSVE
jgi:hypothetical protein